MDRRDFLKAASTSTLAAAIPTASAAAQSPSSPTKPAVNNQHRAEHPGMVYRQLGTTRERVSAIGLGGAHAGSNSQDEAVQLIRSAIDGGITFLDNCWDYTGGLAEVRMGAALADGYRDKVFLMTKMDGRDKETYNHQLEESLARFHTPTIDLVQFHEVIRMEDPDRIFAKGGAMEAARDAREAGKIRYIGFTGHKDPAVHLRMLEVARKNNFHFDTAQMPINLMDPHFRSFLRQVVPVCNDQGIGVLAMKTFGSGPILKSGTIEPTEAIHFSLSQPVSVVIVGMDKPEVLTATLQAASTFQPLTPQQQQTLLARTATAAESGEFELFKTTPHFDGTAHNPQWLG